MGSGIGVQGELLQARNLGKAGLQEVVNSEGTLGGLGILQRVQTRELAVRGNLLVDLGIVFHRAGTQGIEARVHTEVVVAHVGVVAHNAQLVNLGQQRRVLTHQALRQVVHVVLAHLFSGRE